MQQMTSEICASMPVNKVYTLTDSRDKKSYRIARLADGYCWMLDDLSYSGSAVIYNGHYYYRSPSSSACPSGWGIPYSATYYYGDSYSDPAYGPFPSGYDTKFGYISMNTNSQNPQWSLSSGSTYYFTTGRFYNSSSDSYRMFTISSSGRVSISLRLIYTDYFDRCGSIRCKTN